jgi:hypothetical protein
MSDETVSDYIDRRAAEGDKAPLPDDPDTRSLAGTVALAQSALGSPAPPEGAEDKSRAQVLAQMGNGVLPRTSLHEGIEPDTEPTVLERIGRAVSRLWRRR